MRKIIDIIFIPQQNALFFVDLSYSAHKNAYPKTRLNHSNYKDIFKTMIQMEDEIESKRALSHDQYNQSLIHVNHCVYSIKTVCISCKFRLGSIKLFVH